MRICPSCKRSYGEEVNFCPIDGAELPTSDPLLGTLLLDQFELREVIGTGSMGTVYRAYQAQMERFVAVKILRQELLGDEQTTKRFGREARAAARLAHPNIITVHMVGNTDDGRPFLVMELVTGQSLDELCRAAGPLPPLRALYIARQIASALADAHENGIIHRDLKPANILLSQRSDRPDFVKILDFGIAKILHDEGQSRLTQTGAIFGTPYYLSPEQAAGRELDGRCDLYGLGVILFRMVTGQLPFDSESGMEVLIQHLREPPPRPRSIVESIPEALEAVILRAMRKERARRYQDAHELAEDLDQLIQDLGGNGRRADRQVAAQSPGSERETSPLPAPSPAAKTANASDAGDNPTTATRPAKRSARAAVPSTARAGPIAQPSHPTAPAVTPLRGASAQMMGAADTGWLAQRVLRRRRIWLHVAAAIASITVGSSAGAVYFFYQRGARATPAAQDAPAAAVTADPSPGGAARATAKAPEPHGDDRRASGDTAREVSRPGRPHEQTPAADEGAKAGRRTAPRGSRSHGARRSHSAQPRATRSAGAARRAHSRKAPRGSRSHHHRAATKSTTAGRRPDDHTAREPSPPAPLAAPPKRQPSRRPQPRKPPPPLGSGPSERPGGAAGSPRGDEPGKARPRPSDQPKKPKKPRSNDDLYELVD